MHIEVFIDEMMSRIALKYYSSYSPANKKYVWWGGENMNDCWLMITWGPVFHALYICEVPKVS